MTMNLQAPVDATLSAQTGNVLSYNLLKDVLASSNIDDDEEAVMVTRMRVDPRHVKEFERILRLILKNTHTTGHVSTCVVKPPPGEYTYTSIVKYSSLHAMRQIYPSSVDSGGIDFYKLFSSRDSLLVEPPTYQIEAGFGTWIESDGNTKPMRDDADDTNMVYNTIPKPCCDDSCDNPHGLNVRASFVAPTKTFQLFQPRYQRNNKKGGQKNLRCFPCCRNGRHVSSGFCGDSIRAHVAVSRITESGGIKICPISTSQPAVLAYARFVNLEGAFDASVSGPQVFPGQTIDRHEFAQFVRDKDHPLNPLFPGILRGAAMESTLQSAIFEFNSECKAWHYGWTAPRGQGLLGSDAQHVLEILFVKPIGAYFFCLERLRSDTFSIYSSRRASHPAIPATPTNSNSTIKPEAEAYENDEEIDNDRGQKRKRALVAAVASPSPSLCSSAATAGTGSFQLPYGFAPSWQSTTTTTAPHASTSLLPSTVGGPVRQFPVDLQTSMDAASSPMVTTFKMEPTSPSPTLVAPGSSGLIPTTQMTSSDQAAFVDTNAFSMPSDVTMLCADDDSGDLVHHMLFADHNDHRRVVSSEELPWSELYNLFDVIPTVVHGSEDGSHHDGEDDSPPPSPPSYEEASHTTTSNESASGTAADATASSRAAAILAYL